MSRPQWWRRKQFGAEGIKDAEHARQLIGKMFRDARRLFPMETDTALRRMIAAKLGRLLAHSTELDPQVGAEHS